MVVDARACTALRRKTIRSSPSTKLERHVTAHSATVDTPRRRLYTVGWHGVDMAQALNATGKRPRRGARDPTADAARVCAATDGTRMQTQIVRQRMQECTHRFTTEAAQSKAQRIETTPHCACKTELMNHQKLENRLPTLL